MIQRIQSIYLLLAAIVVMLMYYIPVAIFKENDVIYNMYACHILHPTTRESLLSVVPMAILPLLSLFFSLFAILKFKNRSFQMKLNKLNLLVLLALIAVEGVYFFRISKNVLQQADAQPYIAALAPLIAIIFVVLANKAIKKDDNLVKSIDRIR